MGIEIERKFLVEGDEWRVPSTSSRFQQGYLSTVPERTVRVRVVDDAAWLTIKGLTVGASRNEFEYEIPADDGRQLLALCEQPIIEKERHVLTVDGHTWEVDEFRGVNSGLVIAEVELESEDEAVELPGWVGEEVTGDPRYYNANLIAHPYTTW